MRRRGRHQLRVLATAIWRRHLGGGPDADPQRPSLPDHWSNAARFLWRLGRRPFRRGPSDLLGANYRRAIQPHNGRESPRKLVAPGVRASPARMALEARVDPAAGDRLPVPATDDSDAT